MSRILCIARPNVVNNKPRNVGERNALCLKSHPLPFHIRAQDTFAYEKKKRHFDDFNELM